MRRWWRFGITAALVAALLGSGCEQVTPSGDPLAPVRIAPVAPPAPPAPVQGQTEVQARAPGFDFEGEDRSEEGEQGSAREMDPVELQARFFGVDPAAIGHARPPQAAPAQPQLAQPQQPSMPQIGEWDPTQPLPDGSFGIRLLATLTDVQPPRAVIGLPDGSEQVVQPGAFLEQQRLVVMAIGRDVVQVARVVPQGFYARIDTQDVRALFPSQRREPTP